MTQSLIAECEASLDLLQRQLKEIKNRFLREIGHLPPLLTINIFLAQSRINNMRTLLSKMKRKIKEEKLVKVKQRNKLEDRLLVLQEQHAALNRETDDSYVADPKVKLQKLKIKDEITRIEHQLSGLETAVDDSILSAESHEVIDFPSLTIPGLVTPGQESVTIQGGDLDMEQVASMVARGKQVVIVR